MSIVCNGNGGNPSNTSPIEIVRANSYSRSSSNNNNSNNTSIMIASSLPEHCEFGGFDLTSTPVPPLQLVSF